MNHREVVLGRFEIGPCVGRGSCGAVYRAWDRVLEREVAIKELLRPTDEQVMRTSRAAARLNHPAIIPLFELGELDGHAFLVSEFIDGRTLGAAWREGQLTDRAVASIGAELCEALHHAHSRGVVHGDIKPANVIVSASPGDGHSVGCRAKLRDFATMEIAHSGTDLPEEILRSGYLAPEQVDGADPTQASDVFALALTLFECWTGRNPLAGVAPGRAAGVLRRHMPGLADLRPDLPARLAGVIDRALNSDPDSRPGALELREWLDHSFADLDSEVPVPEPVVYEKDAVPHRTIALLAGLAGSAGFACAYLAQTLLSPSPGEGPWSLAPIAALALLSGCAALALAILATRARTRPRPVQRTAARSQPGPGGPAVLPPEPLWEEPRIRAATAPPPRRAEPFGSARVP